MYIYICILNPAVIYHFLVSTVSTLAPQPLMLADTPVLKSVPLFATWHYA